MNTRSTSANPASDRTDESRRGFLQTALVGVVATELGAIERAMAETAPVPSPAASSASTATVRPHQPGQSVFKSILPEDIDWKAFAAFPPSVRLAVMVGQPAEPGPYAIRVKVPGGVKLMPHRHPEDRIYTVISGVFYIGLGERFDDSKLAAYPPGSVVVLPGGTWHFHWAKSGEYVTQVTAIGPLGLEYRNPADDPRERHRQSAISEGAGPSS